MMTGVVMFLVLLASAAFQSLLPAFFWLGQAKFPFFLLVVLYYALNRSLHIALIAGFLAGCFHDVLSPVPLGYSALCFCGLVLIVSRFRNIVIMESLITPAFFGAAAGFILPLCLYALLAGRDLVACSFGWAAWKALGAGVLGLLCAPPVFLGVGRLDRLVGNVDWGEDSNGDTGYY